MGTPSPFEVGRTVGNNFGQVMQGNRDTAAIDKILAQSANNPQQLQANIGQILSTVSPERQPQAIKFLQDRFQAIQGAAAAQRGGYDQYAPAPVQAQQVKDQNKQKRLNDFGLNNGVGIPNSNSDGMNQAENNQQNQQQPQQGKPQQSIFKRMTEDQLIVAAGSQDKEISEPSKLELQQRNEDRKHNNELDKDKRKINNDLGKKVLEQVDKIAETIPQKQSALNLMNQSIVDKNLGWPTWDNLAEITGFEGLRSPEGALFKTASKEYFLGNIARAGARPNQWIEQQISEMLQKVGRSTAANLSVSRALQNELDLDKERIRLTSEIKSELDASGGDYGNLGRQIESRLSKYAEAKQNELFNDLRAIKSIDEGNAQKFHKVEPGTQISPVMVEALLARFNNDPIKAEKEARTLGYEIDEQ